MAHIMRYRYTRQFSILMQIRNGSHNEIPLIYHTSLATTSSSPNGILRSMWWRHTECINAIKHNKQIPPIRDHAPIDTGIWTFSIVFVIDNFVFNLIFNFFNGSFYISPRRDSNPQSLDPKSNALSIRPRGHHVFKPRRANSSWRDWTADLPINSRTL